MTNIFNLQEILNLLKKNIIYILIFFMALTVRCAGIYHKDYVFYDTYATFLCATPSNLTPEGKIAKKDYDHYNFKKSKDYSLYEIKKTLFASDKSIKNIIKDLKLLRNNYIDRSHSNLYYSIFRIWSIGIDGINLRKMIIRGCSLNIVFFIFSFFFLYKLLSLIKDDKKFISLGLFLAFLNNGGISNTLLIREYALMEMLFVCSAYIAVFLCKKIRNNKEIYVKDIILSSIGLALFALSGYFSLIYLIIIFITLITFALIHRNKKALLQIFIIGLLANLIIISIYPSYYYLEFKNEHYEAIKNNLLQNPFNMEYISQKSNRFFILMKNFVRYSFYVSAIILTALLYVCDKFFKFNITAKPELSKDEKFYTILLILTSVLWVCAVFYIAPYRQFRFIAPAFPVLAFIPLILIYKFKNYLTGLILAIYLFFCISPTIMNHNISRYINIRHMHQFRNEKIYKFDILNHYPIVIINKPIWSWYIPNFFLYTKANVPVRIESEIPKDNFKYDKYIIIVHDSLSLVNKKYHFLFKTFGIKVYLKDDNYHKF